MLGLVWLLAVGSPCVAFASTQKLPRGVGNLDLNFTEADGEVVIKTVKIECMPNPTFLRNVTCSMRAVSWRRTNTNMECDIVGKLRNVSLRLEIFKKNDANRFRPFLVNETCNACAVMDKKAFPFYSVILRKVLREVSNVNHSCPYQGRLIVKNFYPNTKFVPLVPPLGLYMVSATFHEGYPYQHVGTGVLYFDVSKMRLQPRPVQSDKG